MLTFLSSESTFVWDRSGRFMTDRSSSSIEASTVFLLRDSVSCVRWMHLLFLYDNRSFPRAPVARLHQIGWRMFFLEGRLVLVTSRFSLIISGGWLGALTLPTRYFGVRPEIAIILCRCSSFSIICRSISFGPQSFIACMRQMFFIKPPGIFGIRGFSALRCSMN